MVTRVATLSGLPATFGFIVIKALPNKDIPFLKGVQTSGFW